MVKMKVKKEVTIVDVLALDYARKIKSKIYTSNNGGRVIFKLNGLYDMENVSHEDMFEVEVEEEITEQSVIPKLVVIYDDGYAIHTTTFQDTSIDTVLSDETVENGERIAFYMLNDDMTMTLLWRNGGMVE